MFIKLPQVNDLLLQLLASKLQVLRDSKFCRLQILRDLKSDRRVGRVGVWVWSPTKGKKSLQSKNRAATRG